MPEKFELDESGDLSSLARQLEQMTSGEKTARVINPGETANVPAELIMDDAKPVEPFAAPPGPSPTAINKPMSHTATIILISVVGLAIVSLALVLFFSLRNSKPSQNQATVPDVKGLSLADARTKLSQSRLRTNENYEPASKAPTGTVIGMSPAPGSKVNPESGVLLTIAGAKPGMPPTQSGVNTDPIVPPKTGDPNQQPGRTNPPTNPNVANPPAVVTGEKVAVPDVEGMLEERAKAKLIAAGFKVASERGSDPKLRDPFVLSMDPPAGSMLEKGNYVKIIVNVPANSGSTTTLQMISIKDYTGRPASEVEAELRNLQLVPNVVAERSNLQQPGRVIKTVPPTGTQVAIGAKVTVLVAQ